MAGEPLQVPTAQTPEEAVETLWELLSPNVPSP